MKWLGSLRSLRSLQSLRSLGSRRSLRSLQSPRSLQSLRLLLSLRWLQSPGSLFSPATGLQLAADAIPAPWTPGRIAIYVRISACQLQSDGSLPDPTFALPGEPPLADSVWDGGADYSQAYTLSALERAQSHDVSTALRRAADDHATARLARMYQVLSVANAATGEDVLARLDKSGADPERMATLARWLARKAPDAIAVKFSIGMLGRYGSASDADLLMTLGLHEEFTLLCAIALCKLLGPEQSQTAMWNLARRVRGWGRIYLVRKLASTQCPEIRQWLLRDGYKNTRMNGYLACLCAIGGRLLEALQAPTCDERLLAGAGQIIEALMGDCDGPAGTMADYPDGLAATLAYLHCVLRQRPQQLQVAASVIRIAGLGHDGWDEAQLRHVRHLAGQVLAMDYWPALVQDKLRSGSDDEFALAVTVAPAFHVDAWEFQFAKQQRRERSQWFGLTNATDPARVERYLALAVEQLDLAALQGPMAPVEHGAIDAETHSAINWLAIGLRKFPGKGWPILRAALTGGDWANRCNAVDTLEHWRESHWTTDAVTVLDRAWRTETHPELKQQMEQLLHKIRASQATELSGT